ncbi:MAG: tyrosine-type recombinase/integrase [Candidatus Limnocylindrales bacterium]
MSRIFVMSHVRPLSGAEVGALWEAADRAREVSRERALLALCLDTGGSRSEIARLTQGDLDLDLGVLTIGSGPKTRIVRLGVESPLALTALPWSSDPDAPLVRSRSGAALTARTIHEQLKRLGDLSGVGDWVSSRHTRRTWLAETVRAATLEVGVIITLAGHRPPRIQRATADAALAAQYLPGWVSPLDRLLADGSTNRVSSAA